MTNCATYASKALPVMLSMATDVCDVEQCGTC
jgi:hypothetical protein